MTEFFTNFHFLRPAWLLAIVPAFAVWWRLHRGSDPRLGLSDEIAPHLLNRLVTSPADRPRLRPTVVLLPIWLIAVVAVAGPSFRRVPSPFAEDASELVLVVKMTPSMLTTDVQPTRLERARTKVHDLLSLRQGAGAALIAYSGSAHLVMPTTNDSSVIDHMLEALDPSVMPVEGDALTDALRIASDLLADETKSGSILVLADSVDASQVSGCARWRIDHGTNVQILAPLRDPATLERSGIPVAAKALDARVQIITPDDVDVQRIAGRADQTIIAATDNDASQWRDDGYLFVPVLVLGVLLWCRRGWSIATA